MSAVEAIPIRRAEIDLNALMHGAMAVLVEQARALDIELKVSCAKDMPKPISLDPEKIAWAVATLVGNAFRYVRRGTRLRPGGAIAVEMHYDKTANEAVLAVQDDGPGIPAAKVNLLFKRSEDAPHAIGLGLMLVQDVVAAHGGHIEVKTSTASFDHGTTITLRLPVK